MKWETHHHNGLRTFVSGAYLITERHNGEEKVYDCFCYGVLLNVEKPRYTVELAQELCDIYEGQR